jgi:S-methylmethionine-dependent homocysteine/selenocysteine methylase
MVGRLRGGQIVLIDGGMGTELQMRGASMDAAAWSAVANLDHLELVQAIHEEYIKAGADVIITNTFASGRLSLAAAGRSGEFERANSNAVAAALRARENAGAEDTVVAGSIAMFHSFQDEERPDDARARADSYRAQAEILAGAGVDLIALEMITTIPDGRAAIAAARETGLPVWLGLTPKPGEDGELRSWTPRGAPEGPPFEEVVAALVDDRLDAVTLLHSVIDVVVPGLQTVRLHFEGPLGAYPEVGTFREPNWEFSDLTPGEYLEESRTWIAGGAQLIGGCCGVRPEHIRALSQGIPRARAIA